VSSAVEIQREMAERKEELSDDRKMKYRIGVNPGDVYRVRDQKLSYAAVPGNNSEHFAAYPHLCAAI